MSDTQTDETDRCENCNTAREDFEKGHSYIETSDGIAYDVEHLNDLGHLKANGISLLFDRLNGRLIAEREQITEEYIVTSSELVYRDLRVELYGLCEEVKNPKDWGLSHAVLIEATKEQAGEIVAQDWVTNVEPYHLYVAREKSNLDRYDETGTEQ